MTRRCAVCTAKIDERCPGCNSDKLAVIGHTKPLDPKYPLHDRLYKCMSCGNQFAEGQGGVFAAALCPRCELNDDKRIRTREIQKSFADATQKPTHASTRGGIRGGAWQNNPDTEAGHPPKTIRRVPCEPCKGTGSVQLAAGDAIGPLCRICDGSGERKITEDEEGKS